MSRNKRGGLRALLRKHYEEQGARATYYAYYTLQSESAFFYRRRNVIVNMLPRGSGKALDLGCGVGAYSTDMIRMGFEVISVDISSSYLKRAKSLSKNMGSNNSQHFVLADAQNLPFRSFLFDLILCSEVLEHVPDYIRALVEIKRVLKYNAILVLSFPSSFSFTERLSQSLEHLHRFSPIRLRKLLHVSGFCLLSEKYCNFGIVPLGSVYRRWKSNFLGKVLDYTIRNVWIKFDELVGKIPLVKIFAWCYIIKLIKSYND